MLGIVWTDARLGVESSQTRGPDVLVAADDRSPDRPEPERDELGPELGQSLPDTMEWGHHSASVELHARAVPAPPLQNPPTVDAGRGLDWPPWRRSRSRAASRARVASRSRSSPTARAPRSSATATTILNYGPVGGYEPLREWVAERHGVEPAQVLSRTARSRGSPCSPGSCVEPGRARPRRGADLRPRAAHHRPARRRAASRADGRRRPRPRRARAARPRSSTRSRPSRTRAAARSRSSAAARLAELARDGKLLVLEDDPYALVRYEGEPLPSVYELAGGEGVVYSFSFSKIVAPGPARRLPRRPGRADRGGSRRWPSRPI